MLTKVRYPGAMPNILTIKKSDASQLKARQEKAKSDRASDTSKKDKENKASGSGTKPLKSSSNWLSRITKKHAAKQKEAGTSPSKNGARALGKGYYMYTRDRRIAPKSLVPHPGGTRCYCLKYQGTIVKPSKYYDKVWLVEFNDGKSYACSEGLLKFISHTSPTHKFVRNEEGEVVLQKIDQEYEDREAILDSILNSKIHFTIGHDKITYETLLALFNPITCG